MNSNISFAGKLETRVIRPGGPGLAWHLKNRLTWRYAWGYLCWLAARLLSRSTGIPTLTGQLSVRLFRATGEVVEYGIVSRRLVTTAFVNFVVDQLQVESALFGDFKYHDSGVGVTAEAIANTAIETTDGEARATGTQTEGAANEYKSVGTIAYTTTKAITEHGLFNDLTAGTLMDRSVFAAINVVNGDSVAFTYTLSVAAGG